MARVVELFQNFRENLKIFSLNKFIGKFCLLFAFPVQLLTSSAAFFLFEAQAADDYGISFYMFSSALSCVIHTLNVAWKMDKILTLLGNYEQFIDTRLFW